MTNAMEKASDRDHEAFLILAVLNRYLLAVDVGDVMLLETCFATDAAATYDGVFAGRSRQGIVDFLVSQGVGSTSDWAVTMHALSSWSIVRDGASAKAVSIVDSTIVDMPRESGKILRRGLRYRDKLIQSDGEWMISHREHTLMWMYVIDDRLNPPHIGKFRGTEAASH